MNNEKQIFQILLTLFIVLNMTRRIDNILLSIFDNKMEDE